MTEPKPSGAAAPPVCVPLPTSTHIPIGSGTIICSPPVGATRLKTTAAIPLSITLQLPPGVELDRDVAFSLLYVVNGSLDYSRLFSQSEAARHATAIFKAGETQTSFTLTTLPLPPGSTFELEIIAAVAGAGTVISIPPGNGLPGSAEDGDDRSLKALSALATAALVTALGALALALLRTKD